MWAFKQLLYIILCHSIDFLLSSPVHRKGEQRIPGKNYPHILCFAAVKLPTHSCKPLPKYINLFSSTTSLSWICFHEPILCQNVMKNIIVNVFSAYFCRTFSKSLKVCIGIAALTSQHLLMRGKFIL